MLIFFVVAGNFLVVTDGVGDACVEIVNIVRPISQNNVWTTDGALFF